MPDIDISGQGIYYEDSGGDGPAVVCLHGFLFDHRLFDPQVAALAERYRLIRWDARAFGRTRWDGEPFDLYDSVADCLGLMDHLDIQKAVLMGMSQGGYCALRFALRPPDRIRGLALLSTRSGVDEEEGREAYRQTRDLWRTAGPVPDLVEGLAGAILGPRESCAEAWALWLPRWRQHDGERIFHAMNNLLERDEITPRLGEIQAPAVVIHGDADVGIPAALGEALAEALPGCRRFVPVSGAAHAANFTHPEAVNQALEIFLRSLEEETPAS